jgi:hypothetical protein
MIASPIQKLRQLFCRLFAGHSVETTRHGEWEFAKRQRDSYEIVRRCTRCGLAGTIVVRRPSE